MGNRYLDLPPRRAPVADRVAQSQVSERLHRPGLCPNMLKAGPHLAGS